MNAELVFWGRHVSMARRTRRRWLVTAVYAGLALLFAASWWIDQWGLSSAIAFVVGIGLSRGILGGFGIRGLVKPFNPTMIVSVQRKPLTDEVQQACHNDERDIRFRDRAHYYSHCVLTFLFVALWAMAFMHHRSLQSAALFERTFHLHFPNPTGPVGFLFAHYDTLSTDWR